ncbi:MAG: phenylalanine--tRNA ligase subunit beta [Planctomycetaceae bacterium]|nr:phenylalanine--tRNA ligase subunit beta [Planctomycetaceae bacterium]
MIVSQDWLNQYVELSKAGISVEQLTDRLTMSGLNLEEFHPVGNDVAIDVEVTSNRPDCLGHIGVAREAAVLFDLPLNIPAAEPSASGKAAYSDFRLSIECPDLCPEYHARLIRGVRIGPSPAWLVDRLSAIGVNSVNNVVDVTNYVMMECGQPLHAFDFDKLKDKTIVVRRAKAGEKITAIDQKQYALSEEMCVIADAEMPVAVAGVMGGLDTEISDSTVNVLIETASFASLSVRSTARSLKLHSPSSYRFERKVDRRNLDWASRRCCELILQIAGGELAEGSVVAGEGPPADAQPVTLRFSKVTELLGIVITPNECVSILSRLGLELVSDNETSAAFKPPSWRQDLTRECDLIEEVARIHGYDQIPTDATLPVVATCRTTRERVLDGIRSHFASCGMYEALTLSFVSEDQRQLFKPRGTMEAVAVSHSSRSHENQLRQSLIPSLLQCRRQNERHGTVNAELFEIAKVYLSAGQGEPERQAEPTMVSFVSGRSFAAGKGLVETLVARLAPNAVLTTEPCEAPEFAAGRGAAFRLNGQAFGWIGELDRQVTDAVDLEDAVTIAELDVHLLEDTFELHRLYTPIPRFPVISRDLNFVVSESITWSKLVTTVTSAGGSLLKSVDFNGQYRGKQIETGCKSYVVTCRFLAEDRTLTADEVDLSVNAIIAACASDLSAKLRA